MFGAASVPAWKPAVHIVSGALADDEAERFLHRLRDGYKAPEIGLSEPEPLLVAGGLFAIVSATRGLLPASVHTLPRLRWTQAFAGLTRTLIHADAANAPALVIGNAGHANYFHWLLQCVAAMLVHRLRGPADMPLVIPAAAGWRRDVIDLFGIADPLVEVPPDTALAIDRGCVSNLTSGDYAFAPHPAVLALFASRGERLAAGATRSRRLYLSRADTPARRPLANEAALVDLLAKQGFDIVLAGALPLKDQIALIRQAALVVAPHGAALTNLAWVGDGPDGPRVVELLPAGYLNRCFAKLAQAKRLDYTAVVNPREASGVHHHDTPWHVDLKFIARVLDF